MNTRLLRRPILILALALLLATCSDTQQSLVATPATASASPITIAPAPTTAASSVPPRPTAPPDPSATPTLTRKPTVEPTLTAIPAATATPGRVQRQSSQHYVFPVRSEGKISYGRYHHDYPATDIFCPVGSAFVAVTDGVVDYVSREDTWDPKVNDGATRGGLSVAIIGDDGVRYYGSHLSQVADGIAPGVRVTAGQPLGLTGQSGDARGVEPHLHFGISHPTTPEDWAVRRGEIPPYDYLRAWQRGEDVAPKLP